MVEIELLSVPGCPHVAAARKLLKACIDESQVRAQVHQKVGDYPSPTILVDGVDVMGSPPVAGASCRLDTPTRERMLAAIRPKRKPSTTP